MENPEHDDLLVISFEDNDVRQSTDCPVEGAEHDPEMTQIREAAEPIDFGEYALGDPSSGVDAAEFDVVVNTGDFRRIHPCPQSGADVPDDMDARLVVLGIEHPYSKDSANKAQAAAIAILQQRGSGPRIFQNALVFLAVDQTRLQDLDESVRRYLAWSSVLDEKEGLNLDPHQVRQAETQLKAADGAVIARMPEAYQWLLVPVQATPQEQMQWQTFRLTGQDGLAVRASKKLRSEELFIPSLAGTRLRMELDRVPLWRGNHVSVSQLAEDFSRYVYLPRLRDPQVLSAAVQDGLGLLLWHQESFAYADGFDDATGRYRGLRCGQRMDVFHEPGGGLVVRPEIALKQQEADIATAIPVTSAGNTGGQPPVSGFEASGPTDGAAAPAPPIAKPRRYYGTVPLDPTRVGRDAGRIADEVIAHLAGLIGSEVTVTLEIEAKVPIGVPDNVVRTVTENSRTLKFKSHGFESD